MFTTEDIDKAIEVISRKTTIPDEGERWVDVEKAYETAVELCKKAKKLTTLREEIANLETVDGIDIATLNMCLEIIDNFDDDKNIEEE